MEINPTSSEEQKNNISEAQKPHEPTLRRAVAIALVIGFLGGLAGGMLGFMYAAKSPSFMSRTRRRFISY
jgi:uncharacterized protein involved in exopolysaccharide biosynthesis